LTNGECTKKKISVKISVLLIKLLLPGYSTKVKLSFAVGNPPVYDPWPLGKTRIL